MKILLTILVTVFLTISGLSQNYKQVKIYINQLSDIELLQQAGLEFDHPNITKDKAVNVFVSESDYSKLQSTNFRFEVLIDDWYAHYNNLPQLTDAEKNEFIEKSTARAINLT